MSGGPAANEMLLSDPPTDGISCVRFAPASDLLLASSWDSVRTLYLAVTVESSLDEIKCAVVVRSGVTK